MGRHIGCTAPNGASHCMEPILLRCEKHEHDVLKQEFSTKWKIEKLMMEIWMFYKVFKETLPLGRVDMLQNGLLQDHKLIPEKIDICRNRLKS